MKNDESIRTANHPAVPLRDQGKVSAGLVLFLAGVAGLVVFVCLASGYLVRCSGGC
jgi:hypothetical protein